MRNLSNENHETLVKETEDDTSGKIYRCSWVKIPLLPKAVYRFRFSAIPIKTPMTICSKPGQGRAPPTGIPAVVAVPRQLEVHVAYTEDTTGTFGSRVQVKLHFWDSTGSLSYEVTFKTKYLIHRNKHRVLGKFRRQRNMFQIKEKDRTSEK